MTDKLERIDVLSWDTTYLDYLETGYPMDVYSDTGAKPFEARPVATVEATPELVALSLKYGKANIPIFVLGTNGKYDGGWEYCELYTNTPEKVRLIKSENDNVYYVVLSAIWTGYPEKNGMISFVPVSEEEKEDLELPLFTTSNHKKGNHHNNNKILPCVRDILLLILFFVLIIKLLRLLNKKNPKYPIFC